MLTLRLTSEQAIILRNALMVLRQEAKPESRPAIQEILDAVIAYLSFALKGKDNVVG